METWYKSWYWIGQPLVCEWEGRGGWVRATMPKKGKKAKGPPETAEEKALRARAPPAPGPHQGLAIAAARLMLTPRQLLLLLLLIVCVAATILFVDTRAERAADRMRRRIDMLAHVGQMTDAEFVRYYRVPSKQAFDELVRNSSPG